MMVARDLEASRLHDGDATSLGASTKLILQEHLTCADLSTVFQSFTRSPLER